MTAPSLVVAPIVEGHGELRAVPALIRRIGLELLNRHIVVEQPWRLAKSRMTKHEELARPVRQQRARVGGEGLVLVVVDADDDDPDDLRLRVIEAAGAPIVCAVAVREYEAWLLAGQGSSAAWNPALCEEVADAKGRLGRVLERRYRETVDQVSVTAQFDLVAAVGNSPSLAQLVEVLRRPVW